MPEDTLCPTCGGTGTISVQAQHQQTSGHSYRFILTKLAADARIGRFHYLQYGATFKFSSFRL